MRIIKFGGSLLDLPDLSNRLSDFLEQLIPPMPSLILVGGGPMIDSVRRFDQRWKLDETGCHWLCVRMMDSTAELLHLLFPDWDCITSAKQLNAWVNPWMRSSDPESLESPGKPSPQRKNSIIQPEESSADPLLARGQKTAIVAPAAFYSRELNSNALPCSWETTSDSIAVLLAKVVHAEELLVLKSLDPPIERGDSMKKAKGYLRLPSVEIPLMTKAGLESEQQIQRAGYIDRSFLESLPANLLVGFFNFRSGFRAKSCSETHRSP